MDKFIKIFSFSVIIIFFEYIILSVVFKGLFRIDIRGLLLPLYAVSTMFVIMIVLGE